MSLCSLVKRYHSVLQNSYIIYIIFIFIYIIYIHILKKLYNVSLNAVLPGAADVAVVLPSAMTEFAQKLVLKEERIQLQATITLHVCNE